MVTSLLLLHIAVLILDVEVNLPDAVTAGEAFQCEIIVSTQDLRDVECRPSHSEGLLLNGTGSMRSFSSVTTPAGTSITSSNIITLSYTALYEGSHTIGPVLLVSSGRTIHETDVFTVTATGTGTSMPNVPQPREDTSSSAIAWMEIEIDTTGRVYPGQTFRVDYYICKSSPLAEVVDLDLKPSDYAASEVVETAQQLQWSVRKDGSYRTWILSLEITPAFPCTLSLPVLTGRVGIPGGWTRPSREQHISSCGEVIPVYPFPDDDMPDNFSGTVGELRFRTERLTRGYSPGGERCLIIEALGPGSARLRELPELSVEGPATLLTGKPRRDSDGTPSWQVIVQPQDSGNVIIGPDSLAWFDTSTETYRQAVIPPCTLWVYPVVSRPADLSGIRGRGEAGMHVPVAAVSAALLGAMLAYVLHRRRKAGVTDIENAEDPEELLTLLGDHVSIMLTGSKRFMASEEIKETMDRRDVDPILSRRILRLWKDLEMHLTGRGPSREQMSRSRSKTAEVLDELKRELSRRDSY